MGLQLGLDGIEIGTAQCCLEKFLLLARIVVVSDWGDGFVLSKLFEPIDDVSCFSAFPDALYQLVGG